MVFDFMGYYWGVDDVGTSMVDDLAARWEGGFRQRYVRVVAQAEWCSDGRSQKGSKDNLKKNIYKNYDKYYIAYANSLLLL